MANPLDYLKEKTQTKFDYFYYPLNEGYGAICNQLYKDIKDNVLLETHVIGLEHQKGKIKTIVFKHNNQENRLHVDKVISTLPIDLLAKMLDFELPLTYQAVNAVYLLIKKEKVSNLHWIYFIDRDISINRLVEFKNMSSLNTPHELTVLCAEVTQNHPNIIRKVIDDLTRIGYITKKDVLDTKIVRNKYG